MDRSPLKLTGGFAPSTGRDEMTKENICHKCEGRSDQYWIDGKYRWLSSKSGNALRGWGREADDYCYEPNKKGWSAVCENCQEERHDQKIYNKLKQLTNTI